MNQAKRAREIEQFFITITRASAALEATLKREFGLSLGEYRVLDEVASAGKIGIRISDEDLYVLIRVGSDVNTRLDEVEKR